MKKVINSKIFIFLLGVIMSSITLVIASNYMASDIAYTPKDSSWNVTNVGDAIEQIRGEIVRPNSINLLKSDNEYVTSNYSIYPKTFDNIPDDNKWLHSLSHINYNFTSTSDFEISINASYIDYTKSLMGGFDIDFFDGENKIAYLHLCDAWSGEVKSDIASIWYDQNLFSGRNTSIDNSGIYSIVRKNGILYFYINGSLINSIALDAEIKFDKIVIDFYKYSSFDIVNSEIRNIYIGDVTDAFK